MEVVAMESDTPFFPEDNDAVAFDCDDLAAGVLSRFQSSAREEHQHLCAVVGAMTQALKDQGLPVTPIAYFGAIASSLDRLSCDPTSGSDPALASLLSFLAIALPRVPRPAVRSRWAEVTKTLVGVLGFHSLLPAGLKAGLRCATYLLAVGDKTNWSVLEPLYSVLIGFITDRQQKVRKECYSCLSDVLRSFQNLPVLVSASEAITSKFERVLLLAGGSSADSTASEGPKGAMQVLYVLNALKDCLPLMETKFTNKILEYCKKLLELRQSIVTRCIMEVLYAHCSSPTAKSAPGILQDLLCSLAISVPDKEKSADQMASTARLLHFGTRKVYDLNRQICIVKLPIIFNALGDILASEHEEAMFAAMEALKGLICACIDESLIEQGVNQIKTREDSVRKSGPTIIEKICATIEGLLGYHYNAVWDMSFQVLSTTFSQLGESSYYLMVGAIKSLADMQKLPDEDFSLRKQLHECLGSAVSAMGPEKFLSILPLNLDVEVALDANVWLFPILKQHVIRARLIFFSEHILGMVKHIKQKSNKLEKEGRIFSARSTDGLVYALWSLLPAFCNYPTDITSGFKVIQKELCTALREEPELCGIICCSLQTLIRQNNDIISNISSGPDDQMSYSRTEDIYYSKTEAEENLKAIQYFAPEFFSVLSETFLTSSKDSGGCLQATIHEFASISDKNTVKRIFKATMKKLIKATQEAVKAKQSNSADSMLVDNSSNGSSLSHARALLLDLAVSLLPGLGDEEINMLFHAIKPAFQDEEGIMQKKAYKILSSILRERDHILSNSLDEILELMIASLSSCHFAAKRHRLECLYILIVYIAKDLFDHRRRDIISSFLTEIILALKEVNKKARNRAYDLIVEIGHACEDEEKGGRKENLLQFFNLIAGGLAGETPQMVSAAVKGLARLAYEFTDLIGAAYNLLPSAFLLLQRKNREIVKANLGLIKVLVAKSKADGLHMHLRTMVEGLMKWQDDKKNHFKAKVKLLLEMLVRKCGFDAVKAVMPEEHMKLLTNIRKINERKERKAKSEDDAETIASGKSISRHSKWNHSRIFSDFGDDDKDSDSDEELPLVKTVSGHRTKGSTHPGSGSSSIRSVRKLQAAKGLSEDFLDQLEDEPLDLLDLQKTRLALRSSNDLKRKQTSIDEPEIDADGRLIIREDNYKRKKEKNLFSENSDAKSHSDGRSVRSSVSKAQKKRRKTTDSGWAYTGTEYTSKNAGGDFKKEDKLEPYAYWPLDRKLLNRRAERKAVARKGMASVMKYTKKLEGRSASGALSFKGHSMKKKVKKGSKKR